MGPTKEATHLSLANLAEDLGLELPESISTTSGAKAFIKSR